MAGSSCPSQRCSLASEAIFCKSFSLCHDIPFDSPSFLFIAWNVSAVGTLLIFWTEFGFGAVPPLEMQQGYLILISALLAWSATDTRVDHLGPACRRLYLGSHRRPHAAWAAQAARRRGRGSRRADPGPRIPGFGHQTWPWRFYLLFDPCRPCLDARLCRAPRVRGRGTRWLVRDTGPLTDLAARAPCSAHLDRGRDPVLLHKQQHADTDGKRRRREPSVLVKGELYWFLGSICRACLRTIAMIRYEDGENRGRRDIPFLASTVHILVVGVYSPDK